MKIAIVAPIEERVPPYKYGGTERVISSLANELVALGHDTTLFASADSETHAKLVPIIEKSNRSYIRTQPRTWFSRQVSALNKVNKAVEVGNFDIIHNHIDATLLLFKDLYKT